MPILYETGKFQSCTPAHLSIFKVHKYPDLMKYKVHWDICVGLRTKAKLIPVGRNDKGKGN